MQNKRKEHSTKNEKFAKSVDGYILLRYSPIQIRSQIVFR